MMSAKSVIAVSGISGNVTVAFAVLSYAGTLTITLVADPTACPDLAEMRKGLQAELDAVVGTLSRSGP